MSKATPHKTKAAEEFMSSWIPDLGIGLLVLQMRLQDPALTLYAKTRSREQEAHVGMIIRQKHILHNFDDH